MGALWRPCSNGQLNIVKEAPVALDAVIGITIWIPLFEYVVQPVLVNFNPIFRDQSVPLAQRSRIAPDTPGEIALVVTGIAFLMMWMLVKFKIEDRYFDYDS